MIISQVNIVDIAEFPLFKCVRIHDNRFQIFLRSFLVCLKNSDDTDAMYLTHD